MPTLDWIGKKYVVTHHQDVPYRLLQPDLGNSHLPDNAEDTGNLIVQGDNLHALKALLPKYAGRVKCIYIDPPYNTGNEGWIYNDNLKAPEIKKWLGQVVGKEAEDLSRHDKWLCMMYPRLMLLKQFLSEDGVILVSLDEIESGHLRLLMDEVFGSTKRLATIVWNTRNTDNRIKSSLSPDHELIFAYGKSEDAAILGRIIDRSDFKNPDKDERGPYVTDPLKGKATAQERPNLHAYAMLQPGTKHRWEPDPAKGWITDEAGYEKLLVEDRIWWPPNAATGWPRKKRFLSETSVRMPASSFWPEFKSHSGARELDEILDERLFAFPKPTQLVQRIIDYCSPPDSIILDSFAGSGTTAHAVLKQNAEDGGKRRFILVEMEEHIAKNITAERVRRVSSGYTDAKGKAVEGLGGTFTYCTLGENPLFSADGRIEQQVRYDELAEYIWFSHFGTAWLGWRNHDKAQEELALFHKNGSIKQYPRGPHLGQANGQALILLYNGILSDRSDLGGNVLNQRTLDYLMEKCPAAQIGKTSTTIYAARCRFAPARLRQLNLTFKQLPYRINTV